MIAFVVVVVVVVVSVVVTDFVVVVDVVVAAFVVVVAMTTRMIMMMQLMPMITKTSIVVTTSNADSGPNIDAAATASIFLSSAHLTPAQGGIAVGLYYLLTLVFKVCASAAAFCRHICTGSSTVALSHVSRCR